MLIQRELRFAYDGVRLGAPVFEHVATSPYLFTKIKETSGWLVAGWGGFSGAGCGGWRWVECVGGGWWAVIKHPSPQVAASFRGVQGGGHNGHAMRPNAVGATYYDTKGHTWNVMREI